MSNTLDEILANLNRKLPQPETQNEAEKRVNDSLEAKQAILKWMNGEVEKIFQSAYPDFSDVDDYNRTFLMAMFNAFEKDFIKNKEAILKQHGWKEGE